MTSSAETVCERTRRMVRIRRCGIVIVVSCIAWSVVVLSRNEGFPGAIDRIPTWFPFHQLLNSFVPWGLAGALFSIACVVTFAISTFGVLFLFPALMSELADFLTRRKDCPEHQFEEQADRVPP